MHYIKLIFTRHDELGFCNSNELNNIIQKVKPDIIFEELSDQNFKRAYELQTLRTLETDAIKEYMLNHPVKHLAIDNYPLPDNYENDLELMYHRLTSENRDFRNLIQKANDLSFEGFQNLNSERNDHLFESIRQHKNTLLDIINDENLLRIQRQEEKIIKKRESDILCNIYTYSSENQYRQAILFMGSGHRKSMLKLITTFNNQKKIKLKWSYFDSGLIFNKLWRKSKTA